MPSETAPEHQTGFSAGYPVEITPFGRFPSESISHDFKAQ